MHLPPLKLHRPIGEREDRIILPKLGIEAGEELCAALADDDGAGLDELAAVGFHAEVLRVGIASVLGGTGAFLMSHDNNLSVQTFQSIWVEHSIGGWLGKQMSGGISFST